jgi:regulator of replication initiation timing
MQSVTSKVQSANADILSGIVRGTSNASVGFNTDSQTNEQAATAHQSMEKLHSHNTKFDNIEDIATVSADTVSFHKVNVSTTPKYGPPPYRTFDELNEDLNTTTANLIVASEDLADVKDRIVAFELNNTDLRLENNKVYDDMRREQQRCRDDVEALRRQVQTLDDEKNQLQKKNKTLHQKHISDLAEATKKIENATANANAAFAAAAQMTTDNARLGQKVNKYSQKVENSKRTIKKIKKSSQRIIAKAERRADKAEKALFRAETRLEISTLTGRSSRGRFH